MSKSAKPDNCQTSTSEIAKSALETEKDLKSDVHISKSDSQSACSIAQAAETLETTKEIGGQKGPEPTRFGDWEKNGRCTDF